MTVARLGRGLVCVVVGLTCVSSAARAVAEKLDAGVVARGAARKSKGVLPPVLRFGRIQDDLPNPNVTAIVQDKQGLMWLGTEAGLARYDGYEMQVFRHDAEDPASLTSSMITALAVDKAGTVWIGTDRGLNRFDPVSQKFHRYQNDPAKPDSLIGVQVTLIWTSPAGELWVGTDGGLAMFDPAKDTFAGVDALSEMLPTAMIERDGKLYIGTGEQGLVAFDPRTNAVQQYLPDENDPASISSTAVTSLAAAPDGTLWIGTQDAGLDAFNPVTRKFVRYQHDPEQPTSIADDRINTVLVDELGEVWAGTYTAGLVHFIPKTRSFTRYAGQIDNPRAFGLDRVYSSYRDRAGMLWFGTAGGGISTFDRLAIDLGTDEVTGVPVSMAEAPDRTVWIGTFPAQSSGGVYKLARETRAYERYEALVTEGGEEIDLTKIGLWTIHLDASGVLWIGSEGAGLIALDTKNDTFTQYPLPAEQTGIERFWRIVEVDGGLWLATDGGGLVHFDRKAGSFERFLFSPAVAAGQGEQAETAAAADFVRALSKDRFEPAVLWVGTAAGLFRFDRTSSTVTPIQNDAKDHTKLGEAHVLTIHQGDDRKLWLGMQGGGLNRFDPASKKLERITSPHLASGTVYGILPDDDGRLWLSTNGDGLVVMDPKAKTFIQFTAADGLQDNDFAQGSYHRGPSGRMYFGGSAGFNALVPSEIQPDKYAPAVVMSKIRIGDETDQLGRPLAEVKHLDLTYKNTFFSFFFTMPSYAAARGRRYEVKVDGLEGSDHWRSIGTRNFQEFTSLPSGDYVFHVRAVNRHGVPTSEVKTLSFVVTPPPWRTWWAYTGYGVIVAGVLLAIFRHLQQRIVLLNSQNRLAVVERDLELTAMVQTGLLPQQNRIGVGAVDLYGFYRAAAECSGDWWWHEHDPATGTHVVVVGDVTGHGAGPAMITATVCAVFRSQALSASSIPDRLEAVNKEVMTVSRGGYHMVLTVLEFNERSGAFKLYSAGGLPTLTLHNKKPRVVHARGTPAGSDSFSLGTAEGTLAPGSRIMLLTDGLPEIMLANQRQWGFRKIRDVFVQTQEMAVNDAATRIVADADQARGAAPQDDDWTFVLLEWKPTHVDASIDPDEIPDWGSSTVGSRVTGYRG